MKKNLTRIPAEAKLKAIPNSKYVLIADDKLALLQTPIIRGNKIFYLVKIGNKTKEIDVEFLKDISQFNPNE